MIELLTISDLRFLPQTLTLQRSLEAHADEFRLTILCMDAPSAAVLAELSRTELVTLQELEQADPALAETKQRASWREYCWTATPAFCAHRLTAAAPGALVAWVDADIEFFRDPAALAGQLGDGSVLLTPHLYNRAYPIAAPAAELTERYGRFNGGTVVFRHDDHGLKAVALWRDRTLAWCRDRPEPGLYGNQQHLTDLPERVPGTRVQAVPHGVIGPWNGGRFEIHQTAGGPTADGLPVIAYHYQSLRISHAASGPILALAPNTVALPGTGLQASAAAHYRISRSERRVFWRPHAERLAKAVKQVIAAEPSFLTTVAPAPPTGEVLRAARTHWELEASRVAPRVAWALGRLRDNNRRHADGGSAGGHV